MKRRIAALGYYDRERRQIVVANEAESLTLSRPRVPATSASPGPIEPRPFAGRTRKDTVLKAIYALGEPTAVGDLQRVLVDAGELGSYAGLYSTLNDMRLPEKNWNKPLTVRTDKLWSLTEAGRKEAERLGATAHKAKP